MDVSAETGAAGSVSLDHLNERNRVATRSLYNLQQAIFGYRSGKDGRGYVHSSSQCTYAFLKGRVRWEFLFFLNLVSFLNVFVVCSFFLFVGILFLILGPA